MRIIFIFPFLYVLRTGCINEFSKNFYDSMHFHRDESLDAFKKIIFFFRKIDEQSNKVSMEVD